MTSTSDCEILAESVGAYVDGSLPMDLRRAIEAHLIGCKSCREALRRLSFSQAVGLFRGGIHAIQKARAIAIHGMLNALDFNQVNSRTHDHAVYQATSSRAVKTLVGLRRIHPHY